MHGSWSDLDFFEEGRGTINSSEKLNQEQLSSKPKANCLQRNLSQVETCQNSKCIVQYSCFSQVISCHKIPNLTCVDRKTRGYQRWCISKIWYKKHRKNSKCVSWAVKFRFRPDRTDGFSPLVDYLVRSFKKELLLEVTSCIPHFV